MKIHGRCHCGSIQYVASVDPGRTTVCHCTDCQRLTGSAFRVSVLAQDGSFRLVAGTPAVYVKVGDSGARRAQAFCPQCGSPLYTFDADQADGPKGIGLRAGCIDEREALVPTRQKWCRSALAWTQGLAAIARSDGE